MLCCLNLLIQQFVNCKKCEVNHYAESYFTFYVPPPELRISLSISYVGVDGSGMTGLEYRVNYLSGTPPFTGTLILGSTRRSLYGDYVGDYSRNTIYSYSFNGGVTVRGTATVIDASGQTVTATDSIHLNP